MPRYQFELGIPKDALKPEQLSPVTPISRN